MAAMAMCGSQKNRGIQVFPLTPGSYEGDSPGKKGDWQHGRVTFAPEPKGVTFAPEPQNFQCGTQPFRVKLLNLGTMGHLGGLGNL